jgi:hypothetical protein
MPKINVLFGFNYVTVSEHKNAQTNTNHFQC